MLYFYVASHDLDGGAIITASHNPKEYNGIKMVRRGALALSGDAGIKEIKEAIVAGRFADDPGARGPARRRAQTISDDYAEHCLSFIDRRAVPPLKVVLDTGNGMGAVGAARHLPAPAPRAREDVLRARRHLPQPPAGSAGGGEPPRDHGARASRRRPTSGIAWDGDADRCFFIDDTGAFVPGDFVTALLGEAFCRKEPGAQDRLRRARLARGRATAWRPRAARALMNRVGHAFIKKRMRDENAVFGGEVSGHFYFRDNWFADNGMIPALLVLEMLGRDGQALSELLAPLRARYHISGEINSKVADVPARAGAASRSATRDAPHPRSMDGISVDYDDWHFNVRPSNTEPLLRLNLEAYTTGGRWSAAATRCSASSGADAGRRLDRRVAGSVAIMTVRLASGRSSAGRVRASQARCRGFEPRRPLQVPADWPASRPSRRNHGTLRQARTPSRPDAPPPAASGQPRPPPSRHAAPRRAAAASQPRHRA